MDTRAESATSPDLTEAFEEFMVAFEAFKSTNDTRLEDLEAKGAGDVLLDEKLDRLNATLDDQKKRIDKLTIKAARPKLSGAAAFENGDATLHKAAFDAYARKGDDSKMSALE